MTFLVKRFEVEYVIINLSVYHGLWKQISTINTNCVPVNFLISEGVMGKSILLIDLYYNLMSRATVLWHDQDFIKVQHDSLLHPDNEREEKYMLNFEKVILPSLYDFFFFSRFCCCLKSCLLSSPAFITSMSILQ